MELRRISMPPFDVHTVQMQLAAGWHLDTMEATWWHVNVPLIRSRWVPGSKWQHTELCNWNRCCVLSYVCVMSWRKCVHWSLGADIRALSAYYYCIIKRYVPVVDHVVKRPFEEMAICCRLLLASGKVGCCQRVLKLPMQSDIIDTSASVVQLASLLTVSYAFQYFVSVAVRISNVLTFCFHMTGRTKIAFDLLLG